MGKLGILLVIVLGAIAVAQLVRVYEHTQKLKKTGEQDINDRDNNLNAWLMLMFMLFQFGGFIYLMLAYGWTGRGPSASLEGEETDWLLNLNFVIIIAVFFLTNFLLFYFSYKYVRKPGVRATYFPHNNKLEMIWTIVPACVLAVIIILGLRSWNSLTSPAGDGAVVIELYSKQFDWTARYAGEDNVLGKYDYKLTTGTNELGILTTKTIEDAIVEREKKVNAINKLLSNADTVLSDSLVEAQEFTLSHNERILRSLYQLKQNHNKEVDKNAEDDIIVKGTLVLCVGQEYEFNFRSMDVIHSAYFPHFRAQINTVPGMTTRTKFTPSITTAEMREIKNDPKFKYVLMCNKICGKAHYKMKMDIEVLSKAEYAAWLAGKKKETFKLKYGSAPAEGGDDMAKEEGGKSGGDMPAEEATGEAAPIKKEDEI